EQGARYEFAHPLVAEVVRADLSAARRAFLHRRAAEATEASHAGDLAPVAGRLAAHYTAAGDPARAARFAALAADRALALAAPAETYCPAGQPDEAARWTQRALTYLNAASDPAAQALAHITIASAGIEAGGSLADAEGHLAEALRLAGANHLPELLARGHFTL